jgi:formylglycine-generating enzyme required for sulfatase activity
MAYCGCAGRALPTEAQWECASRAGHEGLRYPWGDELDRADRCNIWQGDFPVSNSTDDRYLTTAPMRSYAPNDYGLWQTMGNVWEWCSDWWREDTYATSTGSDQSGPELGAGKVMCGGSYLCHDSYCNRSRNAARSSNTPTPPRATPVSETVTRA